MSELRKDPVTGRWVIISTERRKRPTDFRLESVRITRDDSCPFCEGHEHMTPRELLAHRHNGSGPNTSGWDLRVVPNQFPVLRVEGGLDRQGEGRRSSRCCGRSASACRT
jgi:UDPglucose--hexose-1-phosphate uridylyltransferase